MNRWAKWLLICVVNGLALSQSLKGTEFKPWFGTVAEVEGRLNVYMEQFKTLNTGHGQQKYQAQNAFVLLDASIAPLEPYSLEIEVLTAATRHRTYGFDTALLTGRYRFLNDIVDDS